MAEPFINTDGDIIDGDTNLPLLFPRDANHSPAPFLMGHEVGSSLLKLATFTSDGRVRVDAAVTIDNVDIGDVNIRVKDAAESDILVSGGINPDSTTRFLYNQDQRMSFDTGSLNVKLTGGGGGLAADTAVDDDSIPTGLSGIVSIGLTHGFDGTDWARIDSITQNGTSRLQVNSQLTDGVTDVLVTPEGELRTAAVSQILFEEHFNESPLNPAIFDTIVVGGGTVTISDSFAKLATTTAAGDMIQIHAQDLFRHIFSRTYGYRSGLRFQDINQADIRVEWGMHSHPSPADGWWFRIDNGVLQAITSFQGVETVVNIDAFKPTDGNVHRYDAIYRNYRVIFLVDFVVVHTAEAQMLPLFDEERLTPFFDLTNTGTSAGSVWVEGMGLFDDASTGIRLFGFDGNLFRNVAVNTDGRLLVSVEPPTSPPTSTPVDDVQQSDVAGVVDTFHVIGAGKFLNLQIFSGGAEGNVSGSKIEVFYDPDGDLGVNLLLIDVAYVNGANSGEPQNFISPVVGDGTARMVLRRTNLSGGSTEIFGKWEGFEQA